MSEGRFYVSDFTDMDECIRRVTRVFGVHSVSPAIEMDKDNFEAICEQAARDDGAAFRHIQGVGAPLG